MNELVIKRRSLLKLMNDFLQAAVMGDPEYIPISKNAKATYNGQIVLPGDNEIWNTCVRFQSRQTFVDEITNTAVFMGTATNEAMMVAVRCENPKKNTEGKKKLTIAEINRSTVQWWFYTARIKVENGEITEIEEFTIPEHLVHFNCDAKNLPISNPLYSMPVAPEERVTREEMIAIADTYWEGIQKTAEWNSTIAHPDCQRTEMGELCTNSKRNYHTIQSCFWSPNFLWAIENRRWVVVDEIHGVVVCFATFKQLREGTPPGFIAAEVFKIECGMIRDIMANFKPMTTVSGWEPEQ